MIPAEYRIFLKYAAEVVLIALFYYPILRFIGRTRGSGILRGISLIAVPAIIVLLYLSQILHLDELRALINGFVPLFVIGMIIVFQPEIRRGLGQLGMELLPRFLTRERATRLEEVVEATVNLARSKTGALMALQRGSPMASVVETGQILDAEVSADLLTTLFWPGSPLHDKGVVIADGRVVAAGCVFPLTDNPRLSIATGMRHRAGIGLSEESDAVIVIVSEETGNISVAFRGQLHPAPGREELRRLLKELMEAPARSQDSNEDEAK